MRAIGFKTSLGINEENSFIEFELPIPEPHEHDLLVKIKAIAVNPVDYKVRFNSAKNEILAQPKIIGWDAVGVVEEVGHLVSLFKVGDEVFYAGEITRTGCNAEFQLVNEQIAGKKPNNTSFEEAAAMPLTSLTAWEILFDRMRITREKDLGKSVLVIGGAGGVSSIAIQLAKQIAGLKVVATASRPETASWCLEMGADCVINHQDLISNAANEGYLNFDYILDFVDLNAYLDVIVELIKPQGHIASITGSDKPIALNKLKTKSASFSWEFMFTRSMFNTEDIAQQQYILNRIAMLMEQGIIKSTVTKVMNGLTAENLKEAHRLIESGKTVGKIVIMYERKEDVSRTE